MEGKQAVLSVSRMGTKFPKEFPERCARILLTTFDTFDFVGSLLLVPASELNTHRRL